MLVFQPSLPEQSEIQFQISLLNIMSLGAAQSQAHELEKLLVAQQTCEKQ